VEKKCIEKYGRCGPFSPDTALERLIIVKENPAIFGLSIDHILFILRHEDGDFELFIYFRKGGAIRSWTAHQHIYTKKLELMMKQLKDVEEVKAKLEYELPI
jgi:hypothetical protein